jgi:hypothetical protein
MILVDTSIWIDHGRRHHDGLAAWLTESALINHATLATRDGRLARDLGVVA